MTKQMHKDEQGISYTYDDVSETVTVDVWGNGESVSMQPLRAWFARQFVGAHMHYNGTMYGKVLCGRQWERVWLMCDGFGKVDREFANMCEWDWSHVRDSSDDVLIEVAEKIAQWHWNAGSLDGLIDAARANYASLIEQGITDVTFLQVLKV